MNRHSYFRIFLDKKVSGTPESNKNTDKGLS